MFKKVRTRFAPSPTGYMHIGNLRTALYAFLLARQNNGDFILRIEDTDCQRKVKGAEEIIYESLKATGLNWDEGPDVGGEFGPYIQSKRLETFKKYAQDLVKSKKAYYCFCSKERLEKIKNLQRAAKQPPKYDGHCKNLTEEEIKKNLAENKSYVIRQKMPQIGVTEFYDEVFGKVSVKNSELEDQILIKSDGMPTYNFANVVDDHLMQISHVVRGSEYLSSTPKYNLLYEAFSWDIPKYIDCPPVMKNKTEKLSKRNGDATLKDLLDLGFLPEAIVNYVALLGWSPKSEREIFSLNELIEAFDVSGICKSPAIFDAKKLAAINKKHILNMSDEEFLKRAKPHLNNAFKREVNFNYLVTVLKKRTENFKDIESQLDFLDNVSDYDVNLYENKKMKTTKESSLKALEEILKVLKDLNEFNEENVHDAIFGLVEKLGVKNGVLLWPLRIALSGKQFTPGGGIEFCVLLGKEEAILRVEKGVEKLKETLS